MTLHAPWYLMTVEVVDDETRIKFSHTWCIAWEHDLVMALDGMDTRRVLGLVCMMPAWATPARQWTAREIREVWVARTEAEGEFVRLLDAAGEEFDGGLRQDPRAEAAERRLLWQLQARPRSEAGSGPQRTRRLARAGKGPK